MTKRKHCPTGFKQFENYCVLKRPDVNYKREPLLGDTVVSSEGYEFVIDEITPRRDGQVRWKDVILRGDRGSIATGMTSIQNYYYVKKGTRR